jgi:hypothetical protein
MTGLTEHELHAAQRARQALMAAGQRRAESARDLAQMLSPEAVRGLLRGRRASTRDRTPRAGGEAADSLPAGAHPMAKRPGEFGALRVGSLPRA